MPSHKWDIYTQSSKAIMEDRAERCLDPEDQEERWELMSYGDDKTVAAMSFHSKAVPAGMPT